MILKNQKIRDAGFFFISAEVNYCTLFTELTIFTLIFDFQCLLKKKKNNNSKIMLNPIIMKL